MLNNTDPFKAARERYQKFADSRVAFQPQRSWYRLEHDETAETAEIYIYDAIGVWGIEAQGFVQALDALEAKHVTLRINSPGGSVFDGAAIYNAIERHPARFTVHVDGIAASMASVIALAGDELHMAENAFFMIHEPWSVAIGNAEDMRKEAELLDKITGTAVGIYEKKSNLSADEVRAAMTAETWYTAAEALEAGFITSIEESDGEGSNAQASFDLGIFCNVPEKINTAPAQFELTERSLESLLRDAGLTRRDAKQQIALFKSHGQREAVEDHEFEELAEIMRRNTAAITESLPEK